MKAPSFWNSKGGLSTALLPVAVFYEMVGTLRRAYVKPEPIGAPVICIGNLTAGGAGKTPLALYVGKKLKEMNINAFYLSRGYGGSEEGPLLVNPANHSSRQVGDEPLLLAGILPTVVSKDRRAGAHFAVAKGAKAIIMDDGFQNPSIEKKLSILVVDGTHGFGNGRIIPSGPLREPPESGFHRAHAIVVMNPNNLTPEMPSDAMNFSAKTAPLVPQGALKGKKILAFCGIAYPHKFFDMLSAQSADLVKTVAFADHHAYSVQELEKLESTARKNQLFLTTTAKDFVRLPVDFRTKVAVIELELTLNNPALFDALLEHVVTGA